MEITNITKEVIEAGEKMSYCHVTYYADGVGMFQNLLLKNDLPDDVLMQMCEMAAKRNFEKREREDGKKK